MKKPAKDITNLDNEPLFSIGAASRSIGVHVQTLRIYDENDILSPARSPKNTRLYSMNDLKMGIFIRFLTCDLGVNLVGVKIIIELLKKLKIDPDEYIEYAKSLADNIDITEDVQEQNRERLSKRGRKNNSCA